MDSYDLAMLCGVDINHIDEAAFNKFVGQLRLLRDDLRIDCPVENLGFSQNINRHWIICRTTYRLTSRGHNFLETLNKKTIPNRIKTFFLSAFAEAGKHVVIKAVTATILIFLFLAVGAIWH
jgi:hypothetical protein